MLRVSDGHERWRSATRMGASAAARYEALTEHPAASLVLEGLRETKGTQKMPPLVDFGDRLAQPRRFTGSAQSLIRRGGRRWAFETARCIAR